MKIRALYLSLGIILITIFVVQPGQINAQTLTETTGATGISNTLNTAPAGNPSAIREKIRADMDIKMQNAKTNQEIRSQIIEKNYKVSSTTPKNLPPRIENKVEKKIEKKIENGIENRIENRIETRVENRIENRIDNRLERKASSTLPMIKRESYEKDGRSMQLKALKERKEVLAKQLNVALRNLTELRKRIISRMEKDRNSGKDLSKANELLKIADSKIAIAKQAVEAVNNYTPSESEQLATSTAQCSPLAWKTKSSDGEIEVSTISTESSNCIADRMVNLEQVRALVNKAQMTIKDSHQALNDVVVAIAKISGNNTKNRTATSTPVSSISPTTTPTLSATTTNQ